MVTALAVIRLRDLFAVIMLFGIYSLLSASLFVVLDAVDVAFTEASVGAGIATVFMLGTLALTKSREKIPAAHKQVLPLLAVLGTGAVLIYGTSDIPYYGDPSNPIHHHVAPRYLEGSATEIGVPNVVSAVLASYRGYDTLGETTVVFTAAIGVLVLIGGARRPHSEESPRSDPKQELMKQYSILRLITKLLLPLILLFALYVQFHGDFGPGGGFQAGVIFAAGFVLYALVYGLDQARQIMPPWLLRIGISLGVLIYAGVGVAGILLGGAFLDYGVLDPHDPMHGQHLGIFLVELGVGITVSAVMISIFYAFAGRGR